MRSPLFLPVYMWWTQRWRSAQMQLLRILVRRIHALLPVDDAHDDHHAMSSTDDQIETVVREILDAEDTHDIHDGTVARNTLHQWRG